MREKGYPDVSPRIKVAEDPKTGLVVYHIQIRQDLKVEDPSAILGMPPSISTAEAQALIRGRDGVDGILQNMRPDNTVNVPASVPLPGRMPAPPSLQVHPSQVFAATIPAPPIQTLSGWTSVGTAIPPGLETIFSGYHQAHRVASSSR